MVRVYLAGPLLSKENQKLLEKVDLICKEFDLDTFLPHRDVGVYKSGDSKKFFIADMEPLKQCKLMIAIMDWKGIGSGTAWEMGYAYAKAIPIIGLVEDMKSLNRQERMCVMCFNSVILVDNFESLRKEIKNLLNKI